jgi:hypothetical protein
MTDGTNGVLGEIRDLRRDLLEDRRRADEDRRKADEDRRKADEDRRKADEDRRRSDVRFEKLFGEMHRLGTAIVKALVEQSRILRHHGTILERIDRNLGARRNGPRGNGRAS